MNRLLFCILTITLSFLTNSMDHLPQTPSIWAITCDNKLIKIDKVIAQQSNLLMFLQQKYPATAELPLLIPISKNDFDFFCSCLTIAAENLLADLSDANYSKLMDIAEKLKCPIFYTELMEQLLHGNNLGNAFAREQIKRIKLKKAVYRQCCKKKCIKKSKYNRNSSLNLIYSPDGNYFFENISTKTTDREINLWDAKTLVLIKTFPGYLSAVFSPNSDYLILYSNRPNRTPIDLPLLFSIAHNDAISLLDNHQNYIRYTPTLSPKGRYIIQKIQNPHDYTFHSMLLEYNAQKNIIQRMPLENDWKHVETFYFCPNGKEMLYITTDGNLIKYEINNPANKREIGQKFTDCFHIIMNGSLLSLASYQTVKLFTIKENDITRLSEINSTDTQYGIQTIHYPQKDIVFYNPDQSTLAIVDAKENQKASFILKGYDGDSHLTMLAADKTGGYYLASCHTRPDYSRKVMLSTMIFWNLSDIATRIPGIKIDTQTKIKNMRFTKDGLLVTQGHKTELWDMEGDKILSLGESNRFSLHPNTNSILTTLCTQCFTKLSDGKPTAQPVMTKVWQSEIDTHKAQILLEDIKKSLTLQQALLFNAHYAHTKKQNTPKKIYPNMPDGRTLASLQQEHKFLAKNFELSKDNFIPKNQLTSHL